MLPRAFPFAVNRKSSPVNDYQAVIKRTNSRSLLFLIILRYYVYTISETRNARNFFLEIIENLSLNSSRVCVILPHSIFP